MKSHWSGLAPNPGTGVLLKVGNLHTGRWAREEEEEITVTCLQANDGQGLPAAPEAGRGRKPPSLESSEGRVLPHHQFGLTLLAQV